MQSALLSGTECAVAAIWSEVLQRAEPIESNADFFDLGGDSMTMLSVLFLITEEFSVELSAGAMFNAPSLRELSALIDASRGDLAVSAAPTPNHQN